MVLRTAYRLGRRVLPDHDGTDAVQTHMTNSRLTDPEILGIVFDTGHYLFGAGDEGPSVVEAMDRWADRIWYIHFKDNDPELARRSRNEGWDYFQALRAGIFSELGKGGVDFRAVVHWLDEHGYDGWAVVEQDILPGMGTPKESARWLGRVAQANALVD